MSLISIFIIGIGLAMDAFAASICKGLQDKEDSSEIAAQIALSFGLFQGLMPVLGFFLASSFATYIKQIDHWVAFILLLIIGISMLKESREAYCQVDYGIDLKSLMLLSLATSIDACAVGISFAFLAVNIYRAAIIIAIITCLLSFMGYKIGNRLGLKSKQNAEFAGGLILILMGSKILIEHLFFGA
ncbi:MAG: manganese efflux pump MntP family protein [Peptoniphilaceae bacterium]|nr:manganese efflux pump MntP family protein [Peptoniphilaceae bacterium]MDY6018510.1 manganese efflux pump MntP family protein [Anaerococcus sp.]